MGKMRRQYICNSGFLYAKIQGQMESEKKPINFKESQGFFYCEINSLVLSFMPSYPIFKQQLPTCSNSIIIIYHFIHFLAAIWYFSMV